MNDSLRLIALNFRKEIRMWVPELQTTKQQNEMPRTYMELLVIEPFGDSIDSLSLDNKW
jgi:hypothetical protein